MEKKSLNPLRSLVEYWEIQPKGTIGWNPHKTIKGLFKDIAEEISKRLKVSTATISNVWYAKVPEIPQELLDAMNKHGMSPEKVKEAYRKYYDENVIKPAEDRKRQDEKRKQEALERKRNEKEKKDKKFMEEWS